MVFLAQNAAMAPAFEPTQEQLFFHTCARLLQLHNPWKK